MTRPIATRRARRVFGPVSPLSLPLPLLAALSGACASKDDGPVVAATSTAIAPLASGKDALDDAVTSATMTYAGCICTGPRTCTVGNGPGSTMTETNCGGCANVPFGGTCNHGACASFYIDPLGSVCCAPPPGAQCDPTSNQGWYCSSSGTPVCTPLPDSGLPGTDAGSGGNDASSGGNDASSGGNDASSGGNDASTGSYDPNSALNSAACRWPLTHTSRTVAKFPAPTGGFNQVTGAATLDVAGVGVYSTSAQFGWLTQNYSGLGQGLLLPTELYADSAPDIDGSGVTGYYIVSAAGLKGYYQVSALPPTSAGALQFFGPGPGGLPGGTPPTGAWYASDSPDGSVLYADGTNLYLVDLASQDADFILLTPAPSSGQKNIAYLNGPVPDDVHEWRIRATFTREALPGSSLKAAVQKSKFVYDDTVPGASRLSGVFDANGTGVMNYQLAGAGGPALDPNLLPEQPAPCDYTSGHYVRSITDKFGNAWQLQYGSLPTSCTLALSRVIPPDASFGQPTVVNWVVNDAPLPPTVSSVFTGNLLDWAVDKGNDDWVDPLAVKHLFDEEGRKTSFNCTVPALDVAHLGVGQFVGSDGRQNIRGYPFRNMLATVVERGNSSSLAALRAPGVSWKQEAIAQTFIDEDYNVVDATQASGGVAVEYVYQHLDGVFAPWPMRPLLIATLDRNALPAGVSGDVLYTLGATTQNQPSCPLAGNNNPGDGAPGELTPNWGYVQMIQDHQYLTNVEENAGGRTQYTTRTDATGGAIVVTNCYTALGSVNQTSVASVSSLGAEPGSVGTGVLVDVEQRAYATDSTSVPGTPAFDIRTWRGSPIAWVTRNGLSTLSVFESAFYPWTDRGVYAQSGASAPVERVTPTFNTIRDELGRASTGAVSVVTVTHADGSTTTTTLGTTGYLSGEVLQTSDSITGDTITYTIGANGQSRASSDQQVASDAVQDTEAALVATENRPFSSAVFTKTLDPLGFINGGSARTTFNATGQTPTVSSATSLPGAGQTSSTLVIRDPAGASVNVSSTVSAAEGVTP